MRKSSVIQLTAGLLLAGGGMFFFLRDVKLAQLWSMLRSTPLWVAAGVAVLTLLTIWLRGLRWNLILPAKGGDHHGLFGFVMIGFMVNNFLPAHLGEVSRVLFLWKRNRFTVATSAGSILLERILDSIMYLSFFFIPALALTRLRSTIPIAIPAACGVAASLVGLITYAVVPSLVKAIAKKLSKRFSDSLRYKVITIGKELVSNLDWIFSPTKCLAMIALSFLIVACHVVMMIILVRERTFGFLSGMFAAAWAALGAAIPFSPGYVGTLHAALKYGLCHNGIDPTKAAVVATLYHAIGYLVITAAGLYFFVTMRISFREIGHAKEELKKEESSAE
jgi:hypothetical protein